MIRWSTAQTAQACRAGAKDEDVYFSQVEALYAGHAREEIAEAAARIERARIMGGAERTLGWYRGTLNNVGLANEMTYSRHYPLIEDVHHLLGDNLARTVAFFKRVDQAKPAAAVVKPAHGIGDPKSARFVRARETAVAQLVKKLAAEYAGPAAADRLK